MIAPEIEPVLRQFEFTIQDITKKYQGKQSDRLFSSTVWMTDFLDSNVRSQLESIRRVLEAIQTQDTTVQNNIIIILEQLKEIEKALDNILFQYANKYDYPHIDHAWRQNLLIINEKLKSLRHRVDIITNAISKKKRIEEEDWYGNL